MILLLDTNVFIWWTSTGRNLNQEVIGSLGNPENQVLVSAVSVLEITIKRRLRKLDFDKSVVGAIEYSNFSAVSVTPHDAERAGDLVWFHRDPFDRLLVAQTINLGATLVTSDTVIRAFPGLPTLWAG